MFFDLDPEHVKLQKMALYLKQLQKTQRGLPKQQQDDNESQIGQQNTKNKETNPNSYNQDETSFQDLRWVKRLQEFENANGGRMKAVNFDILEKQ